MVSEIFREQSLVSLRVQHCCFDNVHSSFVIGKRRDIGLILIKRGNIEIVSMNKIYHFDEGTLIFVPEGIFYRSVWAGSPEIEFYTIRVESRRSDFGICNFALQAVKGIEIDNITDRVCAMFYALKDENEFGHFRAFELWYGLCVDIFPRLKEAPPQIMHPALAKAIERIVNNYSENLSLTELASYTNISASRLSHLFGSELGLSPAQLRCNVRVENAAKLLRQTDLSIDEIAEKVGFSSSNYFFRIFKREMGCTPSAYRFAKKSDQ